MENNQIKNKSLLKIEVDDKSNYFICYWNLALKKLLPNYFLLFNSDIFGQIKLSLNLINIKLVNVNNTLENIFEDKLFLIKVYFLNSEKDLTKDFLNNIKNTYEEKNMNVILISTREIKNEKDIQKDCIKLINKIKNKTGLNEIYYLPYDIMNFDKINYSFTDFLKSFANFFSKEFIAKINLLLENLENFDKYDDYKYIEKFIYYFDLLSQINCWNMILNFTEKIIFKEFEYFKDKINDKIKPCEILNFDENKLKMNYINKKLSNVDFNEYILYYYIISSHYLKKYENIFNIIKLIPDKMKLYIKYFKSEFHYIYWNINYIYNIIEFLNKINEENSLSKNDLNKYIIFLHYLCIKYYKEFIYKINYFIPNKNILLQLINNIKQNNIEKKFLDKINNNNEINNKDNNYNIFINDINEYINNKDKISLLFIDNKNILNEILNIYKIIRNKFIQYTNINISIQYIFDEIYLLIFFSNFEEVKNILVSLLNHKYFKNNKFKSIYEYICFIILLILNYLEKNNENLNLIFKLLNINYNKISINNKKIIYEIITNYIEAYDSQNIKEEIKFNLDNIFDINFFDKENKTLFINKLKTDNNEQIIEYKITNKTGIELNIKKIIFIFEEFNINDKNNTDNNNKVIYEINEDKNTFKKIEPYINQKNELIKIELKNIFKINNIYKPIEIQYILNNSIKGIYHIKEKIELIFSEMNINIDAELNSDNFYYNILSIMKINISNINDITELNNKYLLLNLNCVNYKGNSILKIQTELAKNNLNNIFKEVIINENIIEFPPGTFKDLKDLNTIEIPFFIENTNYYDISSEINIELKLIIKQSKESDEALFSFYKIFSPKYSHLFTIGKRFKKIQKKNLYLMQTFLTLNQDKSIITIYNKDNSSIVIDSKQAFNMILILSEKENEIINKLRNNYITFSLNDKKDIKYLFCYPEKNILEEIKEMKEIPYYITINLDNNDINNLIFNEIWININIKKFKKNKTKLMINIKENEHWSVVGRNKIIETFEKDKSEKDIKIILLPLIDGFVPLPEFEFNECEYENDLNTINNIDNINNKYESIEYGSIIEGDKKVIKINPVKEYNLKINLT